MKMQELLAEETTTSYINRLVRTLKIKQLGSGYFSNVFQHPVYHNVVVKVTRRTDIDSVRYLKEAMKHPDNPWFPKIIGIHKVTYHDAEVVSRDEITADEEGMLASKIGHIIFMQKLRKANQKEIAAAVRQIINTIPDDLFPTKKDFRGRERVRAVDRKKLFPMQHEKSYFTAMEDLNWRKIAKYTKDKHVKQLATLLDDLGANDLHGGNVMMRDDASGSHLVFTDPVASDMS